MEDNGVLIVATVKGALLRSIARPRDLEKGNGNGGENWRQSKSISDIGRGIGTQQNAPELVNKIARSIFIRGKQRR